MKHIMSKESKELGSDRILRLLDLVPFLTSHQGIGISDLADQFSVTQDRILEDLSTLWMCGLPGYTPLELIDLSFDSGYVTIRNAETLAKPRALSSEEVTALLLGLNYLMDQISDADSNLREIIEKLIVKIPHTASDVHPGQVLVSHAVPATYRATLLEAIKARTHLDLIYHSLNEDEMGHRIIAPVEIRQERGVEYLLAFCFSAGDYRSFRLDRIQGISDSSQELPPTLTKSSPSVPKMPAVLRVLGSMRMASEKFQLNNSSAETVQMVEYFSEDWLMRQIMSCSGEVVLLEPSHAVLRIRQRAALALAAYSTDFKRP